VPAQFGIVNIVHGKSRDNYTTNAVHNENHLVVHVLVGRSVNFLHGEKKLDLVRLQVENRRYFYKLHLVIRHPIDGDNHPIEPDGENDTSRPLGRLGG
jgi:hypothetical protein